MKLGLLAIVAVISASALLVACGGNDDDDSNGGNGGGSGDVLIVNGIDFGYEPETIGGSPGVAMTVEFRNIGQAPHTFTIDGLVDTGSVAAGETSRVTFTPTAGSPSQFYCTIHGATAMGGEFRLR